MTKFIRKIAMTLLSLHLMTSIQTCTCLAPSSSTSSSSNSRQSSIPGVCNNRRVLLEHGCASFFTACMTVSTSISQAACLQGDISEDCIGVYKVPLSDVEESSALMTRESLAKLAPGIRWVPPITYPKTSQAAITELVQLHDSCKTTLKDKVMSGNLTVAGLELLTILPRVDVAGRVVISSSSSSNSNNKNGQDDSSLRAFQVLHQELLINLNSIDIMIGQTMRGDMGSLTAGQIQILQELRDANTCFDELLDTLPANKR